jgi:CTP:molybdopterin cytidylyltransferase MocA
MKTISENKKGVSRPIALILAGYGSGFRSRRGLAREIRRAYGRGELYRGRNKFLIHLEGQPVIRYLLDAVAGAKRSGRPLYDRIVVYNDVESFSLHVDLSAYPRVTVRQMTSSVGGHLRDFLPSVLRDQRVDVYFGDTPRVTSQDVEYLSGEYGRIFRSKNAPSFVFGIAEYEDLKNSTWLPSRMRRVRTGPNRGMHRAFVGFDSFEARIGNCASFVKTPAVEKIIESGFIDFGYSIRKALVPKNLSRILYHLWKCGHLKMILSLGTRSLDEGKSLRALTDVMSKMYSIDLSGFSMKFLHIKRNAAHWENDIDGPKDYRAFVKRMRK